MSAAVTLVDVDEPTLDRLVHAAITDAAADEVTAPVTPGPAWSLARITWLRDLHRRCRTGLDGPAGQATWAIVADEEVVGAVRLKRTARPEILETGSWLTRSARGRRLGGAAVAAVLREAVGLGAQGVRAETTAANAPALGTLRWLGFHLKPDDDGTGVEAFLMFDAGCVTPG